MQAAKKKRKAEICKFLYYGIFIYSHHAGMPPLLCMLCLKRQEKLANILNHSHTSTVVYTLYIESLTGSPWTNVVLHYNAMLFPTLSSWRPLYHTHSNSSRGKLLCFVPVVLVVSQIRFHSERVIQSRTGWIEWDKTTSLFALFSPEVLGVFFNVGWQAGLGCAELAGFPLGKSPLHYFVSIWELQWCCFSSKEARGAYGLMSWWHKKGKSLEDIQCAIQKGLYSNPLWHFESVLTKVFWTFPCGTEKKHSKKVVLLYLFARDT